MDQSGQRRLRLLIAATHLPKFQSSGNIMDRRRRGLFLFVETITQGASTLVEGLCLLEFTDTEAENILGGDSLQLHLLVVLADVSTTEAEGDVSWVCVRVEGEVCVADGTSGFTG